MSRSHCLRLVTFTGFTALLTILGGVIAESFHDSTRRAISEAWLPRVIGASPSLKFLGALDCTDLNLMEQNKTNPPKPYVDRADCAGNDEHPCLWCPVFISSSLTGPEVPSKGLVEIGAQNCGNGVPPVAHGELGECENGVCTNKVQFVCQDLPIYQVQSGPGG